MVELVEMESWGYWEKTPQTTGMGRKVTPEGMLDQ